MEKENIALIGFRATGKSLIGQLLADKLGWSFVDMDIRLVSTFGKDIDKWVSEHGWRSFREAESKLLDDLSLQSRVVVATGGGVILDEANRMRLKRSFFVVWLRASPETILKRLQQDRKTASQRPPLTEMALEDEIQQVLKERSSHYEQTADLILITDDVTPLELVPLIIACPDAEGILKKPA